MKISVFYEHICEAAEQRKLPVSAVLEKVKSFGITAVDVDYGRICGDADYKKRLDEQGLLTASVYKFFDFGHFYDENEMRLFIDTAKRVGAEKVLCIPGFLNSDDDKAEIMEKMAQGIKKMCGYAREKGITVTLEDFDGVTAPYSTDEGLRWFMDRVDELRYTFDTGNFMYSEIDELKALEVLKDKVVHVHLKDRSLVETAESFTTSLGGLKLYPSPVGSGCVKICESIAKLKELGYDGYYAIEHFGAVDQLDYIEKSTAFLRGAL